MQIEQRHVQRRYAVGIGEIGVGLGLQQVPRTFDATFARSIQQGRETTFVQIFGTGFGDDLAFPLADDAARIDVRAPRGEELDHLGLALRGGPHQRRLFAPAFFAVNVRAGIQQPLRRFDFAAACHRH